MTSTVKLVLVAVIALAVGGGVYYYATLDAVEAPIELPQQAAVQGDVATAPAMPEVTGNVEGTVDALIAGATSEGEATLDEDQESATVVADDQEISDLGQSYDEETF